MPAAHKCVYKDDQNTNVGLFIFQFYAFVEKFIVIHTFILFVCVFFFFFLNFVFFFFFFFFRYQHVRMKLFPLCNVALHGECLVVPSCLAAVWSCCERGVCMQPAVWMEAETKKPPSSPRPHREVLLKCRRTGKVMWRNKVIMIYIYMVDSLSLFSLLSQHIKFKYQDCPNLGIAAGVCSSAVVHILTISKIRGLNPCGGLPGSQPLGHC